MSLREDAGYLNRVRDFLRAPTSAGRGNNYVNVTDGPLTEESGWTESDTVELTLDCTLSVETLRKLKEIL